MDFEQIKELIMLVNSTEITELELAQGGLRIRIRKGLQAQDPTAGPFPGGQDSVGLEAVRAPMVGTFYRSPGPDAPPFVREGDVVVPGQVVCIIEAMKMMNEIETEVGGVVRRILAKDGEPVEYGQMLMLIEPRD
ncbi:MAG TPA: acetyl-CoA carboxylase biotin carboxyl carrier protein [Limnochordia bacterium]|jgi:acetyl-CoA carboxylase biotin carboxyl carrier protein|nr:acetyl-CoA carboxylase biotin carboxyl carrier protein [Limnochordia bacterium]